MIDKHRQERGEKFPKVEGLHYLQFLEIMHSTVQPNLYLEVGTQTGASLKLSKCTSISVDPEYKITHDIIGKKKGLFCFQDTSDGFFSSRFLENNKFKVDLAFLDGMHLFEYLLRDFINTEKHCSTKSVVVLHDCIPWGSKMTKRDRETTAWVGDVWKIVPTLRKYRPDLEIEVVDAAPTGLVIVSNLDPHNCTLSESYDEILKEFLDVEIEEYGVQEYFSSLNIKQAAESRWLSEFPFELPDSWPEKADISIKTAAPTRQKMLGWGDYFYARGLARAFVRLGHRTTVCSQEEWSRDTKAGGIDLVLRGRANFKRHPDRYCLIWAISKGLRSMNYREADHVFWASKKMYDEAIVGQGAGISSLLPQAFDADIMRADAQRKQEGIVFVGRRKANHERISVKFAVAAGEYPRIYGPGWQGGVYDRFVHGQGVENSKLWDVYQSAKIVLNDNTTVMKNRGFVSNRIFDTLACGAIPVSEDVGWIPEDIADYVYVFHDQKSCGEAISRAKNEPPSMKEKRIELAKRVKENHSFDARAKKILSVVSELQEER